MTTVNDQATERVEEILSDALLEHRLHDPTAGKTVEDSALTCSGCGADIPEERRKAIPGVQLCCECKQDADWIEAAAKRNGRPA